MYKNIIFDLGNVLLSFNPMEYLKSKISEEKIQEVYKAIFQSEEWIMLDRGTITEKEAINNIIEKNSIYRDDISLAFEDWYAILKPIEETIKVLEDLKSKGYNIYYLSNFHELAFKEVSTKNSFFELFDGGVVSYEEKIIKPEEEIYRLILKRYNLIPSETIFIDDTKVNVEGAEKLGITTIFLENPRKLREELRKLSLDI
ncbi:HAD family phosphatase [Clostridium sp. Sa3CUN1]|uniref:HAD family phosphatase n=1 Tax=Clostridium gallinarum TaxID=2762246 RepID=A0ABR8PZI5_9CLOT|nr:HAD family phosphatase [Clostridium gallinarum]MBD7913580.1 HAD family phosphatase [Clostridium gallinarum]